MIDNYEKLNQRIYDNCLMYYNSLKDTEMTEKDRGLVGGLYMTMNIVANDYLMNFEEENEVFRNLVDKLEEIVMQG